MSDNLDFWNVAGKEATADEIENLPVGAAVNMESGALRWTAIVREKWVNDEGHTQLRFSMPLNDEVYEPPTLTIVGK